MNHSRKIDEKRCRCEHRRHETVLHLSVPITVVQSNQLTDPTTERRKTQSRNPLNPNPQRPPRLLRPLRRLQQTPRRMGFRRPDRPLPRSRMARPRQIRLQKGQGCRTKGPTGSENRAQSKSAQEFEAFTQRART